MCPLLPPRRVCRDEAAILLSHVYLPIPHRCTILYLSSTFCFADVSPTRTGRGLSFHTLDSASGAASEAGAYWTRPSWDQDVGPAAGVDIRPQRRAYHWPVFIAGNLIFITVVIAEILHLIDLRFDSHVRRCGGAAQGTGEATKLSQISLLHYVDSAILFLASGLVFHVSFSTVLSLIYLRPLSIQSMHTIATEGSMSRAVTFMVYCLAPLSWTWLYGVNFIGSYTFRAVPSCPWGGGLWLGVHVLISGFFVFFFVGIPLLLLSFTGLRISCAPNDSTTLEARKRISRTVLSKGTFLHCFWQLQGVLWVYRVGGFGLVASVLLAICSVIGVTLTAIGSPPPHMPHEPQGDDDIPAEFVNGVQLTPREHEMNAWR